MQQNGYPDVDYVSMKRFSGIVILITMLIHTLSGYAQETVRDSSYTFRSLSEAAAQPDQVYRLSLRGARLDSIPSVIFSMTNLRYLDLSRNRIDSIPPSIGGLTSLAYLDLSGNKLTGLPEEIGSLTALTYLGLNRNIIRQLPPSIGNLESLEILELWDNELEDIPDEIGRLQSLKVLELRGILLSDEQQARIDGLVVKSAKINMSPSCNCKN